MTEEQGSAASIGSLRLFMALGGVAIWLVLAGVVGAIHVATTSNDKATEDATRDSGDELTPGDGGEVLIDPTTGEAYIIDPTTGERVLVDPATGQRVAVDPATGKPTTTTPGTPGATTTTAPRPVGDRTGVSATEIKVGIHAPKTIGGAPLNLAEDPLEGIDIYTKYINDNGGIHGRKIVLDIQDDRYETSGGKAAGINLIEHDNFIISGTLGVDQINAVAIEANKAGVPYHAAGGHEPDFAALGLYQLGTSYDTHVIQLARWMATDASGLKGKRIGISVLDSPLLLPVVDVFKAEAVRLGFKADEIRVVKIKKPTEQSTYGPQLSKLMETPASEVFIPMQDPISTGRMVNECITANCPWTYTFSNFAHEGDTALTLMGNQWGIKKVRGLAAACYYRHANADNPTTCAHMDRAHAQWVAINGQSDWEKDGQGGASGYQIISMLAEALRRAGADPTRESYRAAITGYASFDDLITSPITFAGRSSYAHGSDKMVVYEAQPTTPQTYQQVVPGLAEF
ncbi:MAG: ABC transporter substrate-binding protein [Microthrixaceae bacterium]